jgi:hypothetical protein
MAFPTSTLTQSFVTDLLKGTHDFTGAADVFYLALYSDTTTMTAATATYPGAGSDGELGATGNYTQGGQIITSVTPVWDETGGTAAICDFSPDEIFANATFSAMGALIYNSTNADATVCLLDFVTLQTATAGDFTIQFPAATAAAAIIRIALP